MAISFHKKFQKNFKRRIGSDKKLRERFRQRSEPFLKNPNNKILRDHKLLGGKAGMRFFSVTGDIRVVYFKRGKAVTFFDIGTHNQVY